MNLSLQMASSEKLIPSFNFDRISKLRLAARPVLLGPPGVKREASEASEAREIC